MRRAELGYSTKASAARIIELAPATIPSDAGPRPEQFQAKKLGVPLLSFCADHLEEEFFRYHAGAVHPVLPSACKTDRALGHDTI